MTGFRNSERWMGGGGDVSGRIKGDEVFFFLEGRWGGGCGMLSSFLFLGSWDRRGWGIGILLWRGVGGCILLDE